MRLTPPPEGRPLSEGRDVTASTAQAVRGSQRARPRREARVSAIRTPRSASGPRGPSLTGRPKGTRPPHAAGTRTDAHLAALRREFQPLWDRHQQPAAIQRATLPAALSRPRGPAPSEAALSSPLVPQPFESSPALAIGRGSVARSARPLVSVRRPHPVYLCSPDTGPRFGSRPPVERPGRAVCEEGEARATPRRSVQCRHPALGPCVTSGARGPRSQPGHGRSPRAPHPAWTRPQQAQPGAPNFPTSPLLL